MGKVNKCLPEVRYKCVIPILGSLYKINTDFLSTFLSEPSPPEVWLQCCIGLYTPEKYIDWLLNICRKQEWNRSYWRVDINFFIKIVLIAKSIKLSLIPIKVYVLPWTSWCRCSDFWRVVVVMEDVHCSCLHTYLSDIVILIFFCPIENLKKKMSWSYSFL